MSARFKLRNMKSLRIGDEHAVTAMDRESMAEDVSVSGITSNVVDVAIDWRCTLDCAMLMRPQKMMDCCS